MEHPDLKPNPPEDAQLEAWLCSSASLSPLPDDGFSARVMTALPRPAARQRTNLIRAAVCLAGALAGVALVLLQAPDLSEILSRLDALGPEFNDTAAQLADPAVPIAVGVTAASLWYVFWRDIRLLPRF